MGSNGGSNFTRPQRVLLAGDDAARRALLSRWLREAGCDVTACSSGFDLLSHLEQSVLSGELPEYDVILSDIPLAAALDVLDEFFGCDGVPPAILIATLPDWRWRPAAGAATVLEKPLAKQRLLAEIHRLGSRNASADRPVARLL